MKRFPVLLALLFALQPVASQAESGKAEDSYLKKADKELQSWSAKVDRLQKRAEKAGARTREELDRDIPVVRQKLQTVQKELSKLRGSSESGWESLQRGVEEAFHDVKFAYQNASKFFNNSEKKEEP
jgi:peptidoglycan hydrolase CwlO-like protein